MNGPLAVLKKTEEEIAALLVAGLATQRGGREQLEALAGEVSALKMERLAVELRKLAREQDPTALAGSAFTALAMARKLQERLAPWPEVGPAVAIPFARDPSVQIALPAPSPGIEASTLGVNRQGGPESRGAPVWAPSATAPLQGGHMGPPLQDTPRVEASIPGGGARDGSPSVAELGHWMESGNEILRAHAAELLLERGEEAIAELVRLASKGTVTVRREAIAALGKSRSEATLPALLGLLGDVDCWRALLQAILPFGREAVPLLVEALEVKDPKKKRENRRLMAAALLYRLGAHSTLQGLWKDEDEDPVVLGFALASAARSDGAWKESPTWGRLRDANSTTLGIVAAARAEASGDLDPITGILDTGAIDELRILARWALCGSPIEPSLAQHCLARLSGAAAKDRQRAASVLRGLANPALVPSLAGMIRAGEVDLGSAAQILGDTGGSYAVGVLLDLARAWKAPTETLKALHQVGDPGTALVLLEMLTTHSHPEQFEPLLVSLGDGAVDPLAREMHARAGTPQAGRIQQILLQMKSPRARAALQGTEPDSVEALLSRLGHAKLGQEAARELARRGEAALEGLAKVLQSRDLTARLNALNAVASIKGSRASEILLETLEQSLRNAGNNAESMVSTRALELLARRRVEGAAPLLVKGLASGAYNVEEAAVHAVVKSGPGAIPLAMPLLESSNPSARARAMEALGKLEAAEAEAKGIELLADGNRQVQIAAATALGSIGAATGSQRVVEALGAALQQDTSGWPVPLIQALGHTGQRSAIPHLRRFLQDASRKHPHFGGHMQQQVQEAIKKIEAASPTPPDKGLMGRLRGLLGGK